MLLQMAKSHPLLLLLLCWVLVGARKLSLVVVSRGYFSFAGFSCCGAQALGM